MQTKRFLAGFALAAATAVLLSGCFGTPKNSTVTPQPAASQGTHGVTTPGGGTTTRPLPTPTVTDFAPTTSPLDPAGYLEYARVLFSAAKATKSYSKDDVLLGLYTAYLYGQQSQDNPYFISGQWAADGYPQLAVNTNWQSWYTESARSSLLQDVSQIKTNVKSGQTVFSAFNFLPVGGKNYTVCAVKAATCQEAGYPKITSGMSFKETDNGRLVAQFTVESRISMTINGQSGYLPVKNQMSLFLVKNDSYKGEVGTYPFLIDGWSNSVDRSGFTS